MSVTVLDYGNGGMGNIATGLGLWDKFMGLGKQERQAQLSQSQAQAQAAQLSAGESTAMHSAENDAAGLSANALNSGFDEPISKDTPRFWSDLSDTEQKHVASLFPNVAPGHQHAIPDAYNSWVTRQYRVLPPVMFPKGMQNLMSGGTGAGAAGGVSWGMTGMKQDDKGNMMPQYGPLIGSFSPDQMNTIKQGPEAVESSNLFHPLARDKAYSASQDFAKARTEYSDRVMKTPAIQTYFAGQGEQAGILPLWRDVDSFRQKHMDPKTGAWASDLTPQEAKTLVYRMGRIDNPGAMVRQQEFETIAKGAGVYDNIVAELKKWQNGQGLPAFVVKDLYNVIDQLKGGAEQRAHEAMASWEPELAQRGLALEDVIHDRPALQAFQSVYGPLMPDAQTAKAKLPPGTVFHLPGGQRAQIDPINPGSFPLLSAGGLPPVQPPQPTPAPQGPPNILPLVQAITQGLAHLQGANTGTVNRPGAGVSGPLPQVAPPFRLLSAEEMQKKNPRPGVKLPPPRFQLLPR